ncbi:hypothetical protein RFI_11119, partial [Reticulomyxa filosa]
MLKKSCLSSVLPKLEAIPKTSFQVKRNFLEGYYKGTVTVNKVSDPAYDRVYTKNKDLQVSVRRFSEVPMAECNEHERGKEQKEEESHRESSKKRRDEETDQVLVDVSLFHVWLNLSDLLLAFSYRRNTKTTNAVKMEIVCCDTNSLFKYVVKYRGEEYVSEEGFCLMIAILSAYDLHNHLLQHFATKRFECYFCAHVILF